MSRLLMLANAAFNDNSSKTTAEMAVQTDGSPVRVGDRRLSSPGMDHSVHDYVKSQIVDFLVNSTHDYYDRVHAPEKECEHSYAFSVENDDDRERNQLDVDPEDLLQTMDNLDQCIGTVNDSQNVFEEMVLNCQDDPAVPTTGLGTDLEDILAAISTRSEETVIEVELTAFENLLRYLADDERTPGPGSCVESVKQSPSTSIEFACHWTDCHWTKATGIHALIAHMEYEHVQSTGKGKWYCKWKDCKREEAFGKRYLLVRHLRRHTMDRPFQCSVCSKTEPTMDRLTVHERIHSRIRPYSCSFCSRCFSSTGERRRHVLTHKTIIHNCSFCTKSYRTSGGLRKHVRLQHS